VEADVQRLLAVFEVEGLDRGAYWCGRTAARCLYELAVVVGCEESAAVFQDDGCFCGAMLGLGWC